MLRSRDGGRHGRDERYEQGVFLSLSLQQSVGRDSRTEPHEFWYMGNEGLIVGQIGPWHKYRIDAQTRLSCQLAGVNLAGTTVRYVSPMLV